MAELAEAEMVKPYASYTRYASSFSPVVEVSAGEINLEIDPSRVHNFAGVVFYNDPDGVTPVQPSAGTVIITVRTVIQPHDFADILADAIDATIPDAVDWAANTLEVKASLNGIVGATHARLYHAGNSA